MTIKTQFKNLIGEILGYGTCPRCHDSFWRKPCENPGILTEPGRGMIICNECYESDKINIDKHNEQISNPQPEIITSDLPDGSHVVAKPIPKSSNAFGSVVSWCAEIQRFIPIMCGHGGSMWLCPECAESLAEKAIPMP